MYRKQTGVFSRLAPSSLSPLPIPRPSHPSLLLKLLPSSSSPFPSSSLSFTLPPSPPPLLSPTVPSPSPQAPVCTLYPPHYDAVSSFATHKDLLFSACGVTIKQWDIKEHCLKQVKPDLLDNTCMYSTSQNVSFLI